MPDHTEPQVREDAPTSDEFQRLREQISGLNGGLGDSGLAGMAEIVIQRDIESVEDPEDRSILERLYDERMVEVWREKIGSITDPKFGSAVIPDQIKNFKFYKEENRAQILREYEERIASLASE